MGVPKEGPDPPQNFYIIKYCLSIYLYKLRLSQPQMTTFILVLCPFIIIVIIFIFLLLLFWFNLDFYVFLYWKIIAACKHWFFLSLSNCSCVWLTREYVFQFKYGWLVSFNLMSLCVVVEIHFLSHSFSCCINITKPNRKGFNLSSRSISIIIHMWK